MPTPSSTCAAVANTAKRGTTRASSSTSRTSSTTSTPPPRGSPRTASPTRGRDRRHRHVRRRPARRCRDGAASRALRRGDSPSPACSTSCAFSCSARAPAGRRIFGHPDVDPRARLAATRSRRSTTSSRARTTRRRSSSPPTTTCACAPLHSYKFAAALQAAQAGSAPLYLHVEVNTGHGESGDLSKRVEQEADILAFAAKYLGMDR